MKLFRKIRLIFQIIDAAAQQKAKGQRCEGHDLPEMSQERTLDIRVQAKGGCLRSSRISFEIYKIK